MSYGQKRPAALLLAASLLGLLAACNLDPKAAAKKYVETGNKYFDRAKLKEASIMYRKALQKDAKNPDAYYKLALIGLKEGAYSDAARALQRASQLDPNNVDAAAKLADLYFAAYLQSPARKDQLLEVKTIAARLLKRDPNSFDGHRLNGFVALAEKNPAAAIRDFQIASAMKPGDTGVALALAQTLMVGNQTAEAEALARKVIGLKKDFGPMYNLLASFYVRTGHAQQAEEILRLKVANNPASGEFLAELAGFYRGQKRPDLELATLARLTSDSAKIPNAHLIAGDYYYRTAQPDLAAAEYRKGEQAQPALKAQYQRRQADVLMNQGKSQEASAVVDGLIRKDANDADALAMRAALRLRTGKREDVDGAIADLRTILAKYPNSPASHVLHFNLGRGYAQKFALDQASADTGAPQRDLEQAKGQLEQAIQISQQAGQNFIPAKLTLAEVLLNQGEAARALQLAGEVLAGQPENAAAKLLHARANISLHNYAAARPELEALLKAAPKDADARYQLALVNLLERRFAEADSMLDELRQQGDTRAFTALVDSKNQQGKFDEALQMIQAQLQKAPNPDGLLYLLANTQARAGKFDDAIGSLQKLIAKHPKTAEFYFMLGDVEQQAGKLDAAVQTYTTVKEIAPGDPRPQLRLGMLAEAQGRREKAADDYGAVLKLQPDNPVALNNLAFLRADTGGDLNQALTMAQRAAQKLPDNPNIKDTLAFIFMKKGLLDESMRILKDLVEKHPENASYHLHLAMSMAAKGDKLSARRELGLAGQNRPTPSEAGKIKELMAKIG